MNLPSEHGVYVTSGLAGSGKTTRLLSLAHKLASNHVVVFISLEMERDNLLKQLRRITGPGESSNLHIYEPRAELCSVASLREGLHMPSAKFIVIDSPERLTPQSLRHIAPHHRMMTKLRDWAERDGVSIFTSVQESRN